MNPITLSFNHSLLNTKFQRRNPSFSQITFQALFSICVLDWLITGIIMIINNHIIIGIIKIAVAGLCIPLFVIFKDRKSALKIFIPFLLFFYIITSFESILVGVYPLDYGDRAVELPNIFLISQGYGLFTATLMACQISWLIQSFLVIVLQVYYLVRLSTVFDHVPFHHTWILGIILQILIFYLFERNTKTAFRDNYTSKQKAKQFKRLVESYLPTRTVILSEKFNQVLFFNKTFSEFIPSLANGSDQIVKQLNKLKAKVGSFIYTRHKTSDEDPFLSGLIDILAQKAKYNPLPAYGSDDSSYRSFVLSDFYNMDDPKHGRFDITVTPISWNQSNAYLLFINDVSEKMLVNRLKLEEIFKDRFLASFSHELRTPLNVMLGFITVLKANLTHLQDIEALNTIESSAKVLLISIDSLLDVMLLEKDHRLKLKPKQVKISALMHEMELLMKPYLQKKDVKFILNIENNVPELVHIDEDRVREALLHLLLNAVKFTYQGQISLMVEKTDEDPDMIYFHVKDTGIGIKAEEIPGLFKINIEHGSNVYSKGIGLGLTVSQKLARILGKPGSTSGIQVESQYERGSKFSIGVCIRRKNRESPKQQLEVRYNSTLDMLIKDKEELSFQSDSKVPSERGNYDKKIRVFKTHESLEFGKTEFGDHLRISSLGTSPMHKTRPAAIEEFKLARLISQDEIKLDLPIFHSPNSEISQESSEGNDNFKFESDEGSPKNSNNVIGPKYAPEKRSRFSLACRKEGISKGKVLVVDDNDFNLLIATTFLQDLGYIVKTAANGKEAVEMAEEESTDPDGFFKIIFMDCQMPVMDGYEATQILKEKMVKNEIQLTPIVAITANKNEKDIDKCFESGMDGQISKPITKEILKNQIKELLPEN